MIPYVSFIVLVVWVWRWGTVWGFLLVLGQYVAPRHDVLLIELYFDVCMNSNGSRLHMCYFWIKVVCRSKCKMSRCSAFLCLGSPSQTIHFDRTPSLAAGL